MITVVVVNTHTGGVTGTPWSRKKGLRNDTATRGGGLMTTWREEVDAGRIRQEKREVDETIIRKK